MHVYRYSRYIVAVVVLAAGLFALSPNGADAVGTGNPQITGPAASAKHYSGFDGPFSLNFSDAPKGTYDYYVDQDRGGPSPVLIGVKHHYLFTSYEIPQFTVDHLPAGTGYTFHVTDNAGHTALPLPFVVLRGPPPTCSIQLPAAVRMKGRSSLVHASLSAECNTLHTNYAVWQANKPGGGFAQTFTFDNVRTDTWRIFDVERTGTYLVHPVTARSTENEDVPQNSTRITMRMDSRLSLRTSRFGGVVSLATTSRRYSPSANRYLAWSGRKVVLSYRRCTTCAWHRIGVRTTDRYGQTSIRVQAGSTRQYRATAVGTSATWGPVPALARR